MLFRSLVPCSACTDSTCLGQHVSPPRWLSHTCFLASSSASLHFPASSSIFLIHICLLGNPQLLLLCHLMPHLLLHLPLCLCLGLQSPPLLCHLLLLCTPPLLHKLHRADVIVIVDILCELGIIPIFDVGGVRHGGLS